VIILPAGRPASRWLPPLASAMLHRRKRGSASPLRWGMG
jgi:hypothetical protein